MYLKNKNYLAYLNFPCSVGNSDKNPRSIFFVIYTFSFYPLVIVKCFTAFLFDIPNTPDHMLLDETNDVVNEKISGKMHVYIRVL